MGNGIKRHGLQQCFVNNDGCKLRFGQILQHRTVTVGRQGDVQMPVSEPGFQVGCNGFRVSSLFAGKIDAKPELLQVLLGRLANTGNSGVRWNGELHPVKINRIFAAEKKYFGRFVQDCIHPLKADKRLHLQRNSKRRAKLLQDTVWFRRFRNENRRDHVLRLIGVFIIRYA